MNNKYSKVSVNIPPVLQVMPNFWRAVYIFCQQYTSSIMRMQSIQCYSQTMPITGHFIDVPLCCPRRFMRTHMWSVNTLNNEMSSADPCSAEHGDKNINSLRPRHNGRHFADDIFRCIFLNENAWILIKISLKFVPKGSINNIPALVQIMDWRRPGDKPLSESMLVRIPTHICVTRPQWVNDNHNGQNENIAIVT